MSFTWPAMLLSLLVVPLLVTAYVRLMRRRRAAAAELGLRYAGALPRQDGARRRHLPPALFLVAIVLLLVSLARPNVVLAFPRLEGTVILAFDTSTSMRADDLKPSRMEAAKQAASAFVREQPSTVKIGVVAFSDNAVVTLKPTNAEEEVLAAIDRLAPQGGTSLGEGMFASLGAIAGRAIELPENVPQDTLASLDIGHFGSAVIVLLSDGEHTSRV